MKTNWLKMALVVSFVLAMATTAYAIPSMPQLPFTLDPVTKVITWREAIPGIIEGQIEFYKWYLFLNNSVDAITQRLNTTLAPAATVDTTYDPDRWSDNLDNGNAGAFAGSLLPGIYKLSIQAHDSDEVEGAEDSYLRSEDFEVPPATPDVTAVEEVYTDDGTAGTYHITWTPDETAYVESAYVEWSFDNGSNWSGSGWITNTGEFDTPDIDPAVFWDEVDFRVRTRDTESMLMSDWGYLEDFNAVVWAPSTVLLYVGSAPDWEITYSYGPRPIDTAYFRWRLYGQFAGMMEAYITQGREDEDKNFAIDFNPVDDSTLTNIYYSLTNHVWTMSIRAFAPDDADQSSLTSASDYGIPYGTVGVTANVSTDHDANPWVFTATYHDVYNDYAWDRDGRTTGYIVSVLLHFIYDGTAHTADVFPTMVPLAVGEIELTVNPGGPDLSNPNFLNKYNDWTVEASPRVQCYPDIHLMGTASLDFTTVCPPLPAPTPGATYYPTDIQVPDYVPGPYPAGNEQGVTSGTNLTTKWNLPMMPPEFYGNTAYLITHVEYQSTSTWDTGWAYYSDYNVAWATAQHSGTFSTAPSTVTFYVAMATMAYDNWGDEVVGNYEEVSPDAEIDKWETDNQNPGPVSNKEIVQDPVTMTYGTPWVFQFDTPTTPDFAQYRPRLVKGMGTLYPAPPVDSEPNLIDVEWAVTEDMWNDQIAWVLNPFGTYAFYVRTYDNTVPTRVEYTDIGNPYYFDYTVYEALGEVTDLEDVDNHVSLEFIYMDRVRAGWMAVDHKPFGLDPDRIHYVAELYYYDGELSKWLMVDETDEVYQYDPEPGDHFENPIMYADFSAGDYDFPAGKYQIRVFSYYNDPFTTDSRGDGWTDEFNIEYEGIPMAAPTITTDTEGKLLSFNWVDPTNPTDSYDPYVMEYEVEVYGANGLEHHEVINTVVGEIEPTTLVFSPAVWWTAGNVYSTYRARVRLVDSLGRVGDWSPLSTEGYFWFSGIRTFDYQVRHADGTEATINDPMTDRELWVTFLAMTEPEGFINWDPYLVTFDLQVDMPGDVAWYYDLLQNLYYNEGHVVPVGVEGQVKAYNFFLRPVYDGVPMMGWNPRGSYIIDLEAPPTPADLAVTVNPATGGAGAPNFDWDFNWSDATGASYYILTVNRLSAEDGAVDATHTFTVYEVSELLNVDPEAIFDDRVYGYYNSTVVAYDNLDNASAPATPFEFQQPEPNLSVAPVALTLNQILWITDVEKVSYDVKLEGVNGLHYEWTGVTSMPLSINLQTLFPGQNLYTTWHAYVRAYDRDGNVGAWSVSEQMMINLPNFAALSFEVYKFDGSIVPVATKMNIRDMFLKWAEYNTIPSGFINWDKTKVTFQLHAAMSGGSTQSIDVYNINNGETNIQVPVGEEGKEIVYAFTVDMFYDGVLVVQNSPITKAHYTIDLMAPAVPTGLAHNIAVSPWTFSWSATGGDTTGYTFELQKIDPVTGLVINDYTLDLTATNTTVNPLELNWSVFGSYRWRVLAYDQFRNTSTSTWALFNYTLDGAIAPWGLGYELVGEENSIWDMIVEISNKRTALFGWLVPNMPVIGLDMEQVDYVFELQKSTGIGWVNVKEYSLTWNPSYMESEVTVGISGETTYYRGRVRAEYQTEQTGWIYSDVFAIDLERPEFIDGAEAPSYSSTDEEYPSWLFTWDEATDEEVGLGGFLFVLERLEGDTTHAIAMIDLPVEYETEPEPGDNGIGAYSFSFEEGTYLLEMDPFEYVETIDGIFRYSVIPYDRLENLGSPIAGQFTSVWSDGDDYGTYPFINLYDNWMGEKQQIGTVNNNTYATISFDIFGLEGYWLEFRLNGTLLVEGTDFMLIDSPYGSDLYYLVLLESVRDMIQADDMGELEIYAYVEEGDIVVQFTVDAFSYIYLNQRTGFGFGRFRPALND